MAWCVFCLSQAGLFLSVLFGVLAFSELIWVESRYLRNFHAKSGEPPAKNLANLCDFTPTFRLFLRGFQPF